MKFPPLLKISDTCFHHWIICKSYLFVVKVHDGLGGRLVAFAHQFFPTSCLSESMQSPRCVSYQAFPKFIVPRQIGETHIEAVGDSKRYRPRGLLGGGAAGRAIVVSSRIS